MVAFRSSDLTLQVYARETTFLSISSPQIYHQQPLPNGQTHLLCQSKDIPRAKALWQCNYILGCGRAIARKPTGCVRVQLPWSRAGLTKCCMIQTECQPLAGVGLVFFSVFLLIELIFGPIYPYKNGHHHWLSSVIAKKI